MNNNLKKILTDASVISGIIVYSYFVYLIGEIGYLNAYGISDAGSLITLEVQNVILGLLQALAYFSIFILILISVVLPSAMNRGKKSKFSKTLRRKVLIFVLTSILSLSALPFFEDKFGKFGVGLSFALFVLITFILVFVKLPHLGRSSTDIIFKALSRFRDNGMRSSAKIVLVGLLLALVYVPIINYLVNYDKVAIASSQAVKIVDVSNSKYLLIKQYSDKNILVKYDNNSLSPNYIIQKGEAINHTAYEIDNRVIDNNPLHLKSAEWIRLKNDLLSALQGIRFIGP